ncbi:MAG: hypothetical protein CO129_07290 [Ignavibacteriales bacterium CG_4_9_14_3_um_filter_34_10]|nr:MAG: hypothetical protein CO129_07290 [Ignavibacteriales bacterium CG_4_9_14_3_um_filter_34_10]
MKSIIKNGSIAGLVMGVSLFIGGAILSRIVYGPQMAPEGKFEDSQMNPFYFIWTKLLIGVIFGILFTFVYEKLPLVKKISSTLQGIKYVFIFWIVISLWNLSHPIIYESINYKNQIFWLLYTLCGFLGFGFTLGLLYKKQVTNK